MRQGIYLLSLALIIPQLLACQARSAQTPARVANRSSERSDEGNRERFEQLYAELQEFRAQPAVSHSSRTSDHNDCAAFREIVQGGEAFLPLVIAKIAEGDFFMNQAAREITGIEIARIYPSDALRGEQEISRLWLEWWQGRATSDRPAQ